LVAFIINDVGRIRRPATNAWLHDITCYRNDVNQVGSVAGGSLKCRGYFVATQVFVLLALGWGFLPRPRCGDVQVFRQGFISL